MPWENSSHPVASITRSSNPLTCHLDHPETQSIPAFPTISPHQYEYEYVHAAFDCFGSETILPNSLSALNKSLLSELLHRDDLLWSAALAVGAAYRKRLGQDVDTQTGTSLSSIGSGAFGHVRMALERIDLAGPCQVSSSLMLCALFVTVYLVGLTFDAVTRHQTR